jgi:Cohesin domain
VNPAAAGATPLNLAATVTANGNTTATRVDAFPELLSTRPTDNPGDANVDGTLTIDPNAPLQVTGVTATLSVVVIAFNRAVDPAQVNLYDSPGGSLGAADLTLVGAATGLVHGSLVFNPSSNQATFVKTGGPLAPDVYTLTLVSSATTGFRSLDGQALDGDADGNPGGNYVNSAIAVTASALPALAVPDFARGAGQAVNVPANGTAGIPVTISNASAVTQASFDLVYDPTILTIAPTGAVSLSAAATAAGLTIQSYSVTGIDANHAHLTVTIAGGGGWNPANGATLLTLTATVPATAPYAAKSILDLQNVQVNGTAAGGDAGVEVAAYLGDTSGDRVFGGLDAGLVKQVTVGLGSGFAAYQLADPILIGGVGGNPTFGGLDAALIQQKVVGLVVPQIPNIPGGATPPAGGPDPRLYFVAASARPGETVTVQLRLHVTERAGVEVIALDEAILFDPTRFRVSNVRTGSLIAGFLTVANVDGTAGTIRISQAGATLKHFADGTDGDVLLLDFTVLADARPGPTPLNLAQRVAGGGSATVTAVSDNHGALTLTPAPSDRPDDPGVDAVFLVREPARQPIATTPGVTNQAAAPTGRAQLALYLPFDGNEDLWDGWAVDLRPRRPRSR